MIFHRKICHARLSRFWPRNIFAVPSHFLMRKARLILSGQSISHKQKCCFSLFSFPCCRACTCIWAIKCFISFDFNCLTTEETNLRICCVWFNTCYPICLLIYIFFPRIKYLYSIVQLIKQKQCMLCCRYFSFSSALAEQECFGAVLAASCSCLYVVLLIKSWRTSHQPCNWVDDSSVCSSDALVSTGVQHLTQGWLSNFCH